MKFQMATRQGPTAKTSSKGELPDFILDQPLENAPLVPEVGASTIEEFDKLIDELQESRRYLQSEGEKIQREMAHYNNVAKTASASVKIIAETVREWREAGHPPLTPVTLSAPEIPGAAKENTRPKESKSEVEPSDTENSIAS